MSETTAVQVSEVSAVEAPASRPIPLAPCSCRAIVSALGKLCAKENERRYGATTGVRIERTEKGYRACATDGRVLGIVTGPCDDPAAYPHIPALSSAPNSASSAVLSVKALDSACKAIPKRYGKPILGNLAVVLGETVSTLASTDLSSQSVSQPQNLEGRFPAVEHVMPAGAPVVTFSVDPKLLIALLTAAQAFTNDESKRVTFSVYAKNAPIKVDCDNDAQHFTGLIVPLM
jgi:hypothetical protein